MKKCKQCGIEKSFEDFNIQKNAKDGRWHICKKCRSTSPKFHAFQEEKAILFKEGKARCNTCGKVKLLEQMTKNRSCPRGISNKCNSCNSRITKERQQTESYKKWRREYVKSIDWSKYDDTVRAWRKKNRKELSRKSLEYRNGSIEVRLKWDMRTYTRLVLLKCDVKRTYGYSKLLDCDGTFLRQHIESQFTEGMTWDNYGQGKGKWNMDHIIPCASFDLNDIEQQKICFRWSNIQPMWALENMSKGSLYNGKRHYHNKREN
jgi:hypothetical protein